MSKRLFMAIREQEAHDESVFEDTANHNEDALYAHFQTQILRNLFSDFANIFSNEPNANQINNEERSI